MKTIEVIGETNSSVKAKCPQCKRAIDITERNNGKPNSDIGINHDTGHMWPNYIVCMHDDCDYACESRLKV